MKDSMKREQNELAARPLCATRLCLPSCFFCFFFAFCFDVRWCKVTKLQAVFHQYSKLSSLFSFLNTEIQIKFVILHPHLPVAVMMFSEESGANGRSTTY